MRQTRILGAPSIRHVNNGESGCFGLVLLLAFTACGGSQRVGFSLPDDQGGRVHVPSSGARVTVLDVWATNCEPCKASLPALVARKGDIEARGGKLVLLCRLREGEMSDDARKILDGWGVREPFLVDKAGTLVNATGEPHMPATFVLDVDGRVRWSTLGATADQVLEHLP